MSRFSKIFQNVRYPIMQAPMAGGSNSIMAAAVCNNGGIGSLGCGTADGDTISRRVQQIRDNLVDSTSPFNINIFAVTEDQLADPNSSPLKENIALTQQFLQQYIDDNNLNDLYPDLAPGTIGEAPYIKDIEEQIDAIISENVPIVSSTFGSFTQDQIDRFHNAGITVVATTTNAQEAEDSVNLGVDGIVLQGDYAGGHRAGWTDNLIGYYYDLDTLINEVTQRLGDNNTVPLIACGGIMTSSDINSLLSRGDISGVSLGTVFLNTYESTVVSDDYKAALRNTDLNGFDNINITENITGKWEMIIHNDIYFALEQYRIDNPTYSIPDWPFMDSITYPFHATGDTSLMSIYCGRNTSQLSEYDADLTVEQLMTLLVQDIDSNLLSKFKQGRTKRRSRQDRRGN